MYVHNMYTHPDNVMLFKYVHNANNTVVPVLEYYALHTELNLTYTCIHLIHMCSWDMTEI